MNKDIMKVTVEIEKGNFNFSVEVGSSTMNGTMPICVDGLNIFNLVVQMCSKHHHHEHEDWLREISAKAYIEKHPELLKGKSNDPAE